MRRSEHAVTRPVRAVWRHLAVLAVALAAAGCGDAGTASPSAAADPKPASAGTAPAAIVVDGSLHDALAPYDHESHVHRVAVWDALVRAGEQRVHDCLRDQDLPVPPTRPATDPNSPSLQANLDFPDLERLARDGIALSTTPPPTLTWTPPAGWRTAESACRDQLTASDDVAFRAQALFTQIGRAWEAELAAVDATDEIADERAAFGACLQQHGVPAADTGTETAFLGYVDGQVMRSEGLADADRTLEQLGKVYATCGEPLFAARERLRLERRQVFLDAHASTLTALASAVTED